MTSILDQDYIAFPGLGIEYLNPSRVAFTLFGQQVYWYGVLISLGFVLALAYGLKTAKRHGVKADDIIDMVIVAVPVCIICARAFYVLNKLDNYHSFADVIDIRSGGLAIYGAVIGAVLVVLIMSRIKKVNPGAILDVASLGFLLAQAIGRWGNFINREAYGTQTAMPWGMEIFDASAGARVLVHPCFLYESLWNIAGFIFLHFYTKKKKFSGEIFLLYMAWYGIGRAVIEGLRTDSLYLGSTGIRISQLLGILFFILSVALILYLRAKMKRGPIQTEYQPIYEGLDAEQEEEISEEAEKIAGAEGETAAMPDKDAALSDDEPGTLAEPPAAPKGKSEDDPAAAEAKAQSGPDQQTDDGEAGQQADAREKEKDAEPGKQERAEEREADVSDQEGRGQAGPDARTPAEKTGQTQTGHGDSKKED